MLVELSSRPIHGAPPSKLQQLNKKKAAVLGDRVAETKAKQKKNLSSKKNPFCKWCKISCNSNKTFYDHSQSRKHQRTVASLSTDFNCVTCNKSFCSAGYLSTHNLSVAIMKAVQASQEKKN